jgi:hypothetical protein
MIDYFCRPCRDSNPVYHVDPALKRWAIIDLEEASVLCVGLYCDANPPALDRCWALRRIPFADNPDTRLSARGR